MASFASASAAVECARTIQKAFERFNQTSGEPIHIRIGVDCGEPVEDTHDLFKSTVQRASRLCNVASADQILVSDAVRDECKDDFGFVDCGRRSLKGFQQPVQIFECNWPAERPA
jgi:class 3 adenylate cyclase